MRYGLVVVALLSLVPGVGAHESLLRNIAAVTEAIEREPQDATLYLQRGELYRLHRDWSAARVDFERASTLEPARAAVDFYLARLSLEEGKPDLALTLVSSYLEDEPDHELARTVRARALAALGRTLESASDYARALDQRPSPELYLERADMLVAAGPEHTQMAVRGLEQGVAELGSVPALELRIIELELSRGHLEEALARLERTAASSPEKISWLVRRAEVLEQALRNDEAERDYRAAYSLLSLLPESRRQTRMFQGLEVQITVALERLSQN